jgi:hypothetical protein
VNPLRVLKVNVSSQLIGEPETGVWCSTCNLPSAILVNLAVLMTQGGAETYECDPVVNLVTMHVCDGCGVIYEMPDSPSLRNGSRD